MSSGLTEKQINLLKKIFIQNKININTVKVFGSRATGSYKDFSDLDLVIFAEVKDKTIDKLWTILYESSLPFKVDIYAYHSIKSAALKEHIDSFAKPLFN